MAYRHPCSRVAACAERQPADAYLNVQGDEPFISATAADAVTDAMEHLAPATRVVNAYRELDNAGAVPDHNVLE
jgi:3-deoxy-manno-octulosonate cytidylyltransferase (CMP-KDO synthetase)